MSSIVRTIKVAELPKLNPLFAANNQAKFIKKRAERINRKEIDIYVLELDNKIIGEVTIVYQHDNHPDYTIPGQRVYMEALRVLEAYQRQGHAQHLLTEVIKKVKAQGYLEITIGVEDDNENAKHIYTKFGFTLFLRRDHGDEEDPCDYNVYLKRL